MATKSVASEVLCTHIVYGPMDPTTNSVEAISCRSIREEEARTLVLGQGFNFGGIRGAGYPKGPYFDLENADGKYEYLQVSYDLALSLLAQVPDPDEANELNGWLGTLLWDKMKHARPRTCGTTQFNSEFAAEYLERFGKPYLWATQPEAGS